MDIVFSVCLGSLVLRTKNIHCICVCLGSHACMDIVFSVCLGSLALRTKKIIGFPSVWVRTLVACMDFVFSVCLGSLASRMKNTLCVCVSDWVRLPRLMQIQREYRSAIYFSIGTNGTNGTNRQVVNRRPSGVNIIQFTNGLPID